MALATRKSKGPKTPLNVNILQIRQIFPNVCRKGRNFPPVFNQTDFHTVSE